MKSNAKCRSYVLAVEEFLDKHPGALPPAPAAGWAHHGEICPACRQHWQVAATSRQLLSGLQPQPLRSDPYFVQRLQARLAPPSAPWLGGLRVGWRGLAVAATLFAVTATSFAYDLHRTESPNSDEAMVLDVPHVNALHPSDDHLRPSLSDAMLNLMNP
ncbi:MAG: hypothetical protein ACTHJX_07050 [Terriglobales bacterium]|jgi:hypothetical protein